MARRTTADREASRLPSFAIALTCNTLAMVAGLVLALALVLGGGTRQGLWSDAVVELAGLVLSAALLPILLQPTFVLRQKAVATIVGLILLLPLVQLVGMPPALWTLLPGRNLIADGYGAAGMALPWLPISLDPAATWRSWLSLVPPVAAFLATLSLGHETRRRLSLLILAACVFSVLLGLAQVMQGGTSPLRLYPVTNAGNSVGFFANRNHYAALLYAGIPFTAAWIKGLVADGRTDRIFGLALALIVFAALILGLGMALSRAGISLALAAALASLLLVGARQPQFSRRGLVVMMGATAVGAILVVQFALFDLLARFDGEMLADYRLTIAQTTITAAKAEQPTGAGFGTFVPVYQMFERPEGLLPDYVNHAHNDWLELWLEGGWPGLALLGAFLLWLAFATVRTWWPADTEDGDPLDIALAQAGSIVILLLLLHSLVDYPLHTTAMATVFAFCCGLLVKPQRLPKAEWPRLEWKSRSHHRQRHTFVASHASGLSRIGHPRPPVAPAPEAH